ncbi:Myosin regulatory light polypeptide [Salix suchowensis]|nr:Myosin regulatory light polypeptide [Salix suchowensis]
MPAESALVRMRPAGGRVPSCSASTGALLDIPLEKVRQTFETNVFAALRVAKAVMPTMAERKSGTIVNIGSVVGEMPTFQRQCDAGIARCRQVNIANNSAASFQMPEDSLYKDFIKNIYYRMNVSQSGNSMPTGKFVAKVVSNALRPKPPGSLFGRPSEMSRYPDYLSPNPTPTKLSKSQKSRPANPTVQRGFQLIDHDKDGWVNEGDLKEIFASLGSELLSAFESFDENDSGMVKVDEMRKWLGEIGERMDQREVRHLLLP